MAKELPYFKFEPAQWDNGSIQLCSMEARGVFISICSMYWQRLGILPYKLAVQKVCGGNAVALESLCEEKIITVIDGHICIDFLNEQLGEFENISEKNAKNAREGWEKRRNNATAKRPQSDPNAIRGDKSKGDKRREEKRNIPESVNEVIDYFVTNGYSKAVAIKFFNYYSSFQWKDSTGKKILSWKQKAQAVWFKPENEEKNTDQPKMVW